MRVMISPDQLKAINAKHSQNYHVGLISIDTKVEPHDDYPWGELPFRNVIVKLHNSLSPGWAAVEIDWDGVSVHEWTGGLD